MSFTNHVNSNLLCAGLFVAESVNQLIYFQIMKSPKKSMRRNTIFLVDQLVLTTICIRRIFSILIMFKPTLNAFIHKTHSFKFCNSIQQKCFGTKT